MKHNMGAADRIVRAAIVAVALVIATVMVGASSALGIILFALAAVMVGTPATGFCPLYTLIGLTPASAHGLRPLSRHVPTTNDHRDHGKRLQRRARPPARST